MNPMFTIIWVEDKPKAMKSQVQAIIEYLKSKNFEPNIIHDEDGTKFNNAIKEKITIDIVVTDKNITESIDGIAIIKELKQKRNLTDVLFYSAKGFDPEEVRQEHYGFVEIVEGKDIEDQLKKLINKNLKRCEDIVFLRGLVISLIIDLEIKVNELFVNYFKIPDANQEHFHNYILENQNNSLGGKVLTLEKIIKKKGIMAEFKNMLQDIRELANKRNLLAHCKTDPINKNVLICMGEQKSFNKTEVNKILAKTNDTSDFLDNLINKL